MRAASDMRPSDPSSSAARSSSPDWRLPAFQPLGVHLGSASGSTPLGSAQHVSTTPANGAKCPALLGPAATALRSTGVGFRGRVGGSGARSGRGTGRGDGALDWLEEADLPPTRRVQLVRRDGRDVSTLYGREGGGADAEEEVESDRLLGEPALGHQAH